ncbi:MAG: HD domain-containing protein [Candidatus Magasanikiibacteriota bacterium]
MSNNWKFYPLVENFIKKSFKGKELKHVLIHSLRVSFWIKQLRKKPDEALCIAALAHDIDKSTEIKNQLARIQKSKQGFRDKKNLKLHQENSAQIIGNFLNQNKAPEKMIKRVKMLVSKHEDGGNRDQNILKDSDSISFFENVIDFFLKNRLKQTGEKKVKDKFDYMFNRITTKKARKICLQYYQDALQKLQIYERN